VTIIERVLLLQGIELFSDVSTEKLSFVAMIAQEIPIESGKVLYEEDDETDGLYVVISGAIAITRGNSLIETVGPSGAFGVWALFDDQPRLTKAQAAEPSHLLFVPRDEFYEVLSDHVDIVQSIFKQLVRRVRRLATVVEK
jgi:CRP-like cAMP-binding protein